MELVALSTEQLNFLATHYPKLKECFRGVYAADELPTEGFSTEKNALIVNTDTSDKPGSHWLAIFSNRRKTKGGFQRVVEVFDSYGLPISFYKSPIEVWLKKTL